MKGRFDFMTQSGWNLDFRGWNNTFCAQMKDLSRLSGNYGVLQMKLFISAAGLVPLAQTRNMGERHRQERERGNWKEVCLLVAVWRLQCQVTYRKEVVVLSFSFALTLFVSFHFCSSQFSSSIRLSRPLIYSSLLRQMKRKAAKRSQWARECGTQCNTKVAKWSTPCKSVKTSRGIKRHCNNHVRHRTQCTVVCFNSFLLRAMLKGLL